MHSEAFDNQATSLPTVALFNRAEAAAVDDGLPARVELQGQRVVISWRFAQLVRTDYDQLCLTLYRTHLSKGTTATTIEEIAGLLTEHGLALNSDIAQLESQSLRQLASILVKRL